MIYKIAKASDRCTPVDDIGLFTASVLMLYTVLPVISWLMQGGEYLLPSSRLYEMKPTSSEISYILLTAVIFVLGILLVYILFRNYVVNRTYQKKELMVKKSIFYSSVLILVMVETIQYIISIYYALGDYSSYGAMYINFANMPLFIRQISNVLNSISTIVSIVILIKLFSDIKKYKIFIIVYFIYLFFTIDINGSRASLFIQLFTIIVIWHSVVRPIPINKIYFFVLVALTLFIILGLIRGNNNLSYDFSYGLPLGEFDFIFGNSIHMLQEEKAGNINIPYYVYLNEFISFIPSQILPFTKESLSDWYMNTYYSTYKSNGGGMAFGLIAQCIVGYGLVESFFRGLLMGILSILFSTIIRKYNKWYILATFLSIYTILYNSIRESQFIVFTNSIMYILLTIGVIFILSSNIKKRGENEKEKFKMVNTNEE